MKLSRAEAEKAGPVGGVTSQALVLDRRMDGARMKITLSVRDAKFRMDIPDLCSTACR